MSTTIGRVEVARDRGYNPETATVRYEKRGDGWYVKTPADDDYWQFATPDARERTVKQLINKKWCYRYGGDDAFSNRE